MAETIVKNQVCDACGADIRSEALFCYNCGESVVQKAQSNDHKQTDEMVRETIIEEKESKVLTATKEKNNTNGKKEIKLKSAAALRNKARRVKPKKVEIIWEEHENAPNVWFIAVAVLLLIFTIIIYYIAMILK